MRLAYGERVDDDPHPDQVLEAVVVAPPDPRLIPQQPLVHRDRRRHASAVRMSFAFRARFTRGDISAVGTHRPVVSIGVHGWNGPLARERRPPPDRPHHASRCPARARVLGLPGTAARAARQRRRRCRAATRPPNLTPSSGDQATLAHLEESSWVCSTARSRSSPAPGAASAAVTRCCSRRKARRSWSTTSADRAAATAPTPRPAQQVVDEIAAKGGRAVANYDSVSSWTGAEAMVQQAVDDVRRPRRAHQQRRNPARQDELQHGRGRVGPGHRRPPEGPLRDLALRRRRTGARGRRRPASPSTRRS